MIKSHENQESVHFVTIYIIPVYVYVIITNQYSEILPSMNAMMVLRTELCLHKASEILTGEIFS